MLRVFSGAGCSSAQDQGIFCHSAFGEPPPQECLVSFGDKTLQDVAPCPQANADRFGTTVTAPNLVFALQLRCCLVGCDMYARMLVCPSGVSSVRARGAVGTRVPLVSE